MIGDEVPLVNSGGEDERRSDGWLPRPPIRLIHLAVLSSLAIAQPLLDLLGRNPEFFVAQGIRTEGVLILVAVLIGGLPLPFIAVEALLLGSPKLLQKTAHTVVVGFYLILFFLLLLKRSGEIPTIVVVVCAVILAVVGVAAYVAFQFVRSFVSLMAVGLILIPAGFLFKANSAGLMAPPQVLGKALHEVDCTEPVIFIVFDEFSTPVLLDEKGSINRRRYPNFAALADTSTWYPKAVTIAEYTMIAVPAILTGMKPRPGELPVFEAHPDNLFTLFGGTYDIWALETMTRLCPAELNRRGTDPVRPSDRAISVSLDLWIVYLHLVVPHEGIDRLPPISNTWGGFGDRAPAPEQAEPAVEEGRTGVAKAGFRETRSDRRIRVREFLEALRDGRDRSLFFLHIMLPHGPWDLLASGQRYPAETGVIWGVVGKDNSWADGEFLPQQAYQRYIQQTMYVDRFVGEVRTTLEEIGLFDRSLIVLVADHGVSFEPGQRRRNASLPNAHEILPVPLIIKAPHQREARVVESLVSILDVMPTAVEYLEEEPPWAFDGVAMTAPNSTREQPIEFKIAGGGVHEVRPEYLQRMSDVVHRKLRVFGDGTDSLDLYRIGRHGDLVGRSVRELPSGEALERPLTIDDEEFYRNVDPGAATLPVFVQGSIGVEDEGSTSSQLAVVINGTVGAVVPTHIGSDPAGRFTAFIPPSFLRPGDNDLRIYHVEEQAGAAVLHELIQR